MRFNVKAVAVASIMTLSVLAQSAITPTAASAQESTKTKVAIVDVASIFKNNGSIKAQVAKVEADLKAYEQQLKAQRDSLKAAAEQLKSFKVGSPEYAAQEEKVASMESKLRLEMARKRKELADAESQIYYANYQRIVEAVKFLAGHYKVDLVLRYNSEAMDPAQGESVIRSVMKNVIYHDKSMDMTAGVMQYLDKFSVAGSAPNVR